MAQNIQFLTLFYGVAKKYSTIANDFYITLKMCLYDITETPDNVKQTKCCQVTLRVDIFL